MRLRIGPNQVVDEWSHEDGTSFTDDDWTDVPGTGHEYVDAAREALGIALVTPEEAEALGELAGDPAVPELFEVARSVAAAHEEIGAIAGGVADLTRLVRRLADHVGLAEE